MVKIGNYDYEKSSRKGKKLMVRIDNKLIHFGDSSAEHFFDKTRIWKELDHKNEKKKKNYLTRSAGIKDKEGKLTKDNKLSPNYHSRKILW